MSVTKLKFHATKIKKIIKNDPDIGKIRNDVPVVLSLVLERFITDIAATTLDINSDVKKITPQHLKNVPQAKETLDFLVDTMEKYPDESSQPTRKRKAQTDLRQQAKVPKI
eukprot:TRINITY_DN1003_c0_g1_i1.p1 TRINITY_DN1003_c0_g1~~TRINITY_DN1003_c0_g1_i1.p1  ORF type:complete len:111 (-),score=21.52 TRINITY_DN1003_c0_g1_i1:67-399(-)